MKKKIFAVLMIFILALSLIGCGNAKKSEEDTKEEQKFVENIVCYDEADLKITATKMDYDSKGRFAINLSFENKDDNNDVSALLMGTTLNGFYSVNAFADFQVYAGDTCDGKVVIEAEEIALYGIKDISKVDFSFTLDNMSSYETKDITCSILTYGKEMDIEKPSQPEGKCYVDNEYVTVYINRVEDEDGVTLYIDTRNKSNLMLPVTNYLSLNPPYDETNVPINNGSETITEYGLKVNGHSADAGGQLYSTLLPGAMRIDIAKCSGMSRTRNISDENFVEFVDSKDVDLSTIYGTTNISSYEWDEVTEMPVIDVSEKFVITK